MRIHLRLDGVNPGHIHESLFIDGKLCGVLTFSHTEYAMFGAALLMGAKQTHGSLVVEIDQIAHDKDGLLCMPSEENPGR